MNEIEVIILSVAISAMILVFIMWGIQWEVKKRVKRLELEARNICRRISVQSAGIAELTYISNGMETSFNIDTGIKNPNIGIKEIQKRVELILEKLGVEVEEEARLVEVNFD